MIRTDDGTVVDTLSDGAIIDLAQFGTSGFSIQAGPNQAGYRVVVQLQGPITRRQVERRVPYALFGDQGNIFLGVPPLPGDYTFTATPFVRRIEEGTLAEGVRSRVRFQLVGGDSDAALRVYPNRFDQDFFVEVPPSSTPWEMQLQSIHGQPQNVHVHSEAGRWRIDAASIPSGHYVLRLSSAQDTRTVRIIKK